MACDLLAVCLAAGTPVAGRGGRGRGRPGGPLGRVLVRRWPGGCGWAPRPGPRGPTCPPTRPALARVLVRAGESGSSVVPALRALAADSRAAARAATAAAVQRAGVWVLAPLGLCFLPAFLCLGVVPLVLGIAADVLG